MSTRVRKKGSAFRIFVTGIILVVGCALVAAPSFAKGKYRTYKEYVASLPKGCEPVPQECFEKAVAGKTFAMYDWAAWWPEELYKDFEKEFGIKIVRDNYPNLDEALAKFRLNPKTAYDYWLTNPKSLWYMRNWNILEKINHDWIPNVNRYLAKDIKNASWDPGYNYSVLTTLGYDAYVINTNFINKNDPRIPSWKFLFEGWDVYKDKLIMRNEMNRVIGNTLKYLGYSLNSTNPQELKQAEEALLRLKPHIMAFDSWPKRAVMAQEVWIIEGVVHDYQTLGNLIGPKNPFYVAYPPNGCLLSPMLIVIPKGGSNPAATHLFINYLYRPENFAKLINTVAYGHGHAAIDSLLTAQVKVWMTPPKGYREKCEVLSPQAFTGEGEKLRAKIWEKLK
ncbi:MAG: extracellular solute-binding protein [Deltaproteobacteria bacterium]|nr:extracellular solute-binding protein [Deltaproteobacteria bacterium]